MPTRTQLKAWSICGQLGLVLMVGVLNAETSESAAFYVAKTGNNGYSCSQAQSESTPKLTINAGLACLASGDTLFVKGGTYAEWINPNSGSNLPSGSSGNPTTIKAFSGETVWLAPPSGDGAIYIGGNFSYITFDGINLDGSGTNPSANPSSDGIKLEDTTAGTPSNIIVKNAEIKRFDIGILTGGSFGQFLNLNIHDQVFSNCTGGCVGYGMYIAGSDNIVDGSWIHDNPLYGIHQYKQSGGSNRNIIRNNLVNGNGSNSAILSQGILIGSGDSNVAYNNVVANNRLGMECGGGVGTNCKILNNTIFGNYDGSTGVSCIHVGAMSGSVVQNNICYGNVANVIRNDGTSSTMDHNILTSSDPGFVNAASGNFHLTSSATTAIDQGRSQSWSSAIDKDGVPRPQGSVWDIGAYEYTSSSTSSTSSSSLTPPSNLRVVP